MKKTTIAALAAVTALGLSACAQPATQPNNGDSIPTVAVEATESPAANPSPTVTPDPLTDTEPAPAPPGEVTDGDTYSKTITQGYVFRIPVVLTDGQIVDIVMDEGDNVLSTAPPEGAPFEDNPTMGSAVTFYAAETGTANGSIRVLGADGLPDGSGTVFDIKVVAE